MWASNDNLESRITPSDFSFDDNVRLASATATVLTLSSCGTSDGNMWMPKHFVPLMHCNTGQLLSMHCILEGQKSDKSPNASSSLEVSASSSKSHMNQCPHLDVSVNRALQSYINNPVLLMCRHPVISRHSDRLNSNGNEPALSKMPSP